MIDFQRSEQGEPDPAKDILAVNVRTSFNGQAKFYWALWELWKGVELM